MSEKNQPMTPEAFEEAGAKLFDRIPRKAKFSIETVLESSVMFSKNPTRETALNYSQSAAKASKALRTMVAAAATERMEASAALEEIAGAMKGVATALVGVDHTRPETVTEKQAEASQRAVVPLRRAEMRFALANKALMAAFIAATASDVAPAGTVPS